MLEHKEEQGRTPTLPRHPCLKHLCRLFPLIDYGTTDISALYQAKVLRAHQARRREALFLKGARAGDRNLLAGISRKYYDRQVQIKACLVQDFRLNDLSGSPRERNDFFRVTETPRPAVEAIDHPARRCADAVTEHACPPVLL